MEDNNKNDNMDVYFNYINETLNFNSMDIDDDEMKSKTEKKNSNNLNK